MKHIVKIVFLWLCAALILTACDRNRHTPESEPQKEPISFSALSQNIPVKSETPLSAFHNDFGVWGIARHTEYASYTLWEANSMIQAIANTQTDPETGAVIPTSEFTPISPAYWSQGYTYSFIALAPFESGATNMSISLKSDSNPDILSFVYNIAPKYRPAENSGLTPDFDFDLMGAAAMSGEVDVASKQGAQNLTFRHLLTKLCVKVGFNDADGTVTGMRLVNVDTQASYTISSNADNTLGVTHEIASATSQMTVDFGEEHFEDVTDDAGKDWEVATIHLLPQNISDFELYLDFKIGDVQINNFKVNIDAAKTSLDYDDNEWYNWKLLISPNSIAFEVDVAEWSSAGDPEEFPID